MTQTTFRQAYCSRFGCRPENFERSLLLQCVRAPLRPFAWLAWILRRSVFATDLLVIRSFADSTSLRSVLQAAGEFYDPRRDRSWIHDTFGLRVSGRRLMSLATDLLKPPISVESEAPSDPVPPAA